MYVLTGYLFVWKEVFEITTINRWLLQSKDKCYWVVVALVTVLR